MSTNQNSQQNDFTNMLPNPQLRHDGMTRDNSTPNSNKRGGEYEVGPGKPVVALDSRSFEGADGYRATL